MLSPATAPALAPETEPSIERRIGECMATAVGALAKGVVEQLNGGLEPKTKSISGKCIAELFTLRQSTLGELDFEKVARIYGRLILQERGDDMQMADALDMQIVDDLVDEVLKILDVVVRTQLH